MRCYYSSSVIVTVLALLMSVGGVIAQAQRPQSLQNAIGTAFTYQGQLRTASGPINSNCDFQFGLWDVDNGGTSLASDLGHTNVAVNNGLFTVQIDFGMNVFAGEARWLEIAVRCPAGNGSYVTLSPRQPLTPAPYALFSASTGALQGRLVTTTMPSIGQVLKWDGAQWIPALDLAGTGNAAWALTGNAGTNSNLNFVCTTDNVALTWRVSNTVAFRIMPGSFSPSINGGYSGNIISASV
ncbi:MAG TPA: hypothetical protein VMP08_11060 [Anaerolineae bacterium]|nr:hypothetical protein [Anaerolineae bacterium]